MREGLKGDKPFQKLEESNSKTEPEEAEPKEIENLEEELTEADQAEAVELLSRLKENKLVKAIAKEIIDPSHEDSLSQSFLLPIIKTWLEKKNEKIREMREKREQKLKESDS